MKKIGVSLVLVLCIAMLFSGCAVITNITDPLPQEYVDGVRLPKEYPDDFQVYDDAIVFEVDDDDEGIELTYGTTDDIDDVIDYYEDLFEDNELKVDEQDDDDDEFYAEGMGDDFKFEVSAEPADGNYEERAFATVVEVSIEYYTMGEDTLKQMKGFWHACGYSGIIDDETRALGVAMEFGDMTIGIYGNFEEIISDLEFEFTDENTIKFIDDGEEIVLTVKFEIIDGVDVMTLSGDGEVISFEKSSLGKMMEYEVVLVDSIIDKMQGFWLFCGLDGDISEEYRAYLWAVEYEGMTIDSYVDGEADYLGVEFVFIDDNIIAFSPPDSYELTLDISFIEVNGQEMMCIYHEDALYYYEKSTYDKMMTYADSSNDSSDSVYLSEELTDAELEYLITDIFWYMTYYYYPDDTYEYGDFYNQMYFDSASYTGEDKYESSTYSFSWRIEESILYFDYTDGSTESYLLDFDYDGSIWYLYLFDVEAGYTDTAYVFTIEDTYQ